MRVSTASEAQARPMPIAHGSDATGSKSVNPPSGGGVASTFQPPPCGADARSAGGIGRLLSLRRDVTPEELSPTAVCAMRRPMNAGTSALIGDDGYHHEHDADYDAVRAAHPLGCLDDGRTRMQRRKGGRRVVGETAESARDDGGAGVRLAERGAAALAASGGWHAPNLSCRVRRGQVNYR